ncbi:carbohydrate esterase family 3 protein [Karstenula rhodostoma CBS 690.94]|uniref:Carbohydrate esterase family 3 protein n=1 Tax=Karstenula rhodostoma CBS 690.94 TaxID=1392251 RepID=A0A9P4PV07_9PLEO|nr:carbohydrate esterase family 3 protein [Karstenula rhodostoma CBS 690.94]
MVPVALLSAFSILGLATAQNTTIRYMPFGDSITEIICWRALLWEKLQTTEWASVNFVGSGKTENNCKDAKYDRDNEGHSGFLAIDIATKNQLDGWLKTNPADVLTMHLGTNDIVQQNKNVADIIAAFTRLVGTARTHNPKMKIVVAQIIPMGMGSYNTKIQQLNAQIPPWAAGLNKTESPIWVVDQYTGFSGSADLRDGVHPNAGGDKKMMDVWYPALLQAFAAAKADQGTSTAVNFIA